MNDSWEVQEEYLKHGIGFAFGSFGIYLVLFGLSHASGFHVAQPNNLPTLLLVSYVVGLHSVMFWFDYNFWIAYY